MDPGRFADLGSGAGVDKTLQRLVVAGELRRIDRGLYDRPTINSLTGRSTVPDYRAVIRAVAHRDNARFVVDVCWTLDALYHRLPADGPRLLFKGGTSLSKAYGLIQRFSEDIDITVFRDDLDQAASVEELRQLSNKKRRAKLDAIRDACRSYVTRPLRKGWRRLSQKTRAAPAALRSTPEIPMASRCWCGIPRSSRGTTPTSGR